MKLTGTAFYIPVEIPSNAATVELVLDDGGVSGVNGPIEECIAKFPIIGIRFVDSELRTVSTVGNDGSE